MNGIAAPIVAYEPAPPQDFLKHRRKVSVVMVVYMTGEALQQSVECVLSDPLVDELVVVDNGSTRLEAARLKRLADGDRRVRVIQGQGNVPMRSCNPAASPSWRAPSRTALFPAWSAAGC
jgi:hypothetical protein